MQRRSSRLAKSRHRVVRFEEHSDAGGGSGGRGGGSSGSGAGSGAGNGNSGRGTAAEKCIPGRPSVGSTALSGERVRLAVGESVAGLPCTAEVEQSHADRFSGDYFSSIKLYVPFACIVCAPGCACGLNLHLIVFLRAVSLLPVVAHVPRPRLCHNMMQDRVALNAQWRCG